jgi:glycerol kinase
MIPALHGLGTPWQNDVQAQLGGLSAAVGRAQLARASVEGVAHRVADAAEGLWQIPGEALSAEPLPLEALRVDGGASSSELLLQMIADFTGTRVERSSDLDGGARGVALMAAAAVGLEPGEGDPGGGWSFDRVFEPALTEERRLEQRATWKARVQALVEVSS